MTRETEHNPPSPLSQPACAVVIPKRAPILIGLLVLAGVTALYHGWSLFDGTVLDDHWHQQGLREHGWSLDELLRTLVIEPADFVHLWWQDQPVRWEYGRPVFILAMKLVYHVIGGDDPFALHLFSVLLHFASVCMVWRLGWLLTRHLGWATVGGVLFAMYPNSIVTVAWPSSQNAVLQTTLMLAAMLCYVRASSLQLRANQNPERKRAGDDPATKPRSHKATKAGIRERGSGNGRGGHGSPIQNPKSKIQNEPRRHTTLRRGWTIVALLLWTLAILTRENALMLPAILLALDWVFAGRGHVWRRRWVYVAFALIGVAFVIWRMRTVTHPIPDVYVRRPGGDLLEYTLWCAAKLLHYLCTSIWIAPMTIGPTGRYDPWTSVPGDCLLMLAIVAAIGLGYFVTTRRACGWWIWPLWILLSVLPVVPVVATPHSGYMCGVGFALAVALAAGWDRRREAPTRRTGRRPMLPSRRDGSQPPGQHGPPARAHPGDSEARPRPPWMRRAAATVAVLTIVLHAPFSMFSRWQWTAAIAAERYAVAGVVASPPPAGVTDVFFLNLPFINIYIKPALDAELGPGFRDVRCHVLAYSPQPVLVEDRVYVEQIDEHTLTLATAGQPYFSRLLGRFLLEGFREAGGPFEAGEIIPGEEFDVRIVDADAEGVRKLGFTFRRPLSDPGYCFYLATRDFPAARLRFDEPAAVANVVAESLTDAERHKAAAFIATAIGSPMQDMLAKETLTATETAELGQWWRHNISAAIYDEIWLRRTDYARYVKLREELPHSRDWAALVIRTDLYLTGPAFDGPRRQAP